MQTSGHDCCPGVPIATLATHCLPHPLALLTSAVPPCSALPKIIKTGFAAIHLIYFFTAGSDEVRIWTQFLGANIARASDWYVA